MTLSVNIPVRGRKITNGDIMEVLYPDTEIIYHKETVDVIFKNSPTELYKIHTFSMEWWNSIYYDYIKRK